ncbi:MAG: hypothetical protein ACJ8GW_12905 [Massilia sp.]
MNRITYLRAALLLPLVAGLIALLLMLTGYAPAFISFLLWSTVIGGAPLLLTLLVLLFVSFKVPLSTFERWWWFSPFLMALSCGVAVLGFAMYSGLHQGWTRAMAPDFFGVWIITGAYSLVIGYSYVLVAAMLHILLRTAGLVQREPLDSLFITDNEASDLVPKSAKAR